MYVQPYCSRTFIKARLRLEWIGNNNLGSRQTQEGLLTVPMQECAEFNLCKFQLQVSEIVRISTKELLDTCIKL